MENYVPFTFAYQSRKDRIETSVWVSSNEMSVQVCAVWDTGATGTCISKKTAEAMKAPVRATRRIVGPTGEAELPVYKIDIRLPNRVTIRNVDVMGIDIDLPDVGMLIGMDIINLGDFAISNLDGKTTFSFRMPPGDIIDFARR